MSQDLQILKDFQTESKGLISEMMTVLEQCEDDFSQAQSLEKFGQLVDRIMGGATSLAMLVENKKHLIHKVGDYTAICKMVGYKASQIQGNEDFFKICVALLLDATEALDEIFDHIMESDAQIKEFVSQTLIDRVKWVNTKFSADIRGTVKLNKGPEPQKMTQQEIDNLIKKLGLDD